jgi:CrcB protein
MMAATTLYGAVTLGGIIGSLLRWAVGLMLPATVGAIPWATLFANVTGCLAIGFFATLTGPDGRLFVGPRARQFFMTGICGGYTTFSAFSLETLQLALSGDAGLALLYLALSLAGWLAAVWLGDVLAWRMNNPKGG